MKQLFYHKKMLFLLFFLSAIFSFAQSGVKITFYTATESNYNIDATGKLYFSGDNLLVKETSTSNDVTIPISIIQKITLTSFVLATSEVGANNSQLTLYPNPSTDFIKIKAKNTEKLIVKIFSMSGQLLLKGNYLSDESIDVSSLKSGVYLIQANDSTFKLMKK